MKRTVVFCNYQLVNYERKKKKERESERENYERERRRRRRFGDITCITCILKIQVKI